MNKKTKKAGQKNHAFALAALAISAAPAYAAPWEFGGTVDLGYIHTDNIFLAPSGNEVSEDIYTIVPVLYLRTEGERMRANLQYRPEAFFYQDNGDADSVVHTVDAVFDAALLRDRLFLILNGSNYQSIIVPERQFPTSNVPISGNQVDTRVIEVRPYWQQRLADFDLLLELSYSDIDFDDEDFQSNKIKRGSFSFDNSDEQQGLAFGVGYDHVRAEYDLARPWEYQRGAASLGYWFGNLRLFASGGAETNLDDVLEPNLDESFWELGFQYRPNQRIDLELAVGDRFYGTSYRLNMRATLRRGSTSLIYEETPTTGAQLPIDRRPIDGSDNLDGILDDPGRTDRFLRKRAEWALNIDLSKSELSLRVFTEARENRVGPDGAPQPDEDIAGVALRWDWNVGSRTTVGVSGDFSRREEDALDDDLQRVQLDLEYQFSQRLSVVGVVMHSTQEGLNVADFDYDETQYRLLLRTSFQ